VKCTGRSVNVVVRLIKQIKKFRPLSYILEELDSYFQCCRKKAHFQDGKDFSYSTLSRFLQRMYEDLENRRPHWWNRVQKKILIKDKHPRLTQLFANIYAQQFLDTTSLPLVNPSEEYRCFKTAVDYFISIWKDARRSSLFSEMNEREQFEFLWSAFFDCEVEYTDHDNYERLSRGWFWRKVREELRSRGIVGV